MWYLRDKMSVNQPATTTRRLSAALAESSSSSSHIFMSPERHDWAYYHSNPSSRKSSPVSSRRASLQTCHQHHCDILSKDYNSVTQLRLSNQRRSSATSLLDLKNNFFKSSAKVMHHHLQPLDVTLIAKVKLIKNFGFSFPRARFDEFWLSQANSSTLKLLHFLSFV